MSDTLLIIEDNEQNLYMMRYLLERAGYRVESSGDGPGGIAAARRLHPAAILLDIQLPGMDGYAVAVALRADPELSGTPIVAVTSYAMTGDREKALEAGATGYIEKPIDPDSFVDQIKAFLPDARAERDSQ